MDNVRFIVGRSNVELGVSISKLGIPMVKRRIEDFANGELRIDIEESIRDKNVYILASGSNFKPSEKELPVLIDKLLDSLTEEDIKLPPKERQQRIKEIIESTLLLKENHSINDFIFEMLQIVDACKISSADKITLITPFYPCSRSDKKDAPRVSITAALLARLLKKAGISRLVAMDLHAGQEQGFVGLPFDNLYAKNIIIEHLQKTLFNGLTSAQIKEKFILASPDAGGIKRTDSYAKDLKMDYVIMHKQRNHAENGVVIKSILIGDKDSIKGKTVIMIDDMIDTFGTMEKGVEELMINGANDVIVVATHGLFSYPAFDRINGSKGVTQVIVTNSLPQNGNMKKCNKLRVVDCAPLIYKLICTLENGGSVHSLFT